MSCHKLSKSISWEDQTLTRPAPQHNIATLPVCPFEGIPSLRQRRGSGYPAWPGLREIVVGVVRSSSPSAT